MEEKLAFAKKLAHEAGEIMQHYFTVGHEFDTKADESPVTIADEEINQLVIQRVADSFPGHAVLGEEDSTHGDKTNVWVVDPIDGTNPFIMGIPTNVFSLAYVEDGDPLLGVIYDPYQGRLFWAVKGKGAFLNDEQIATSDALSLAGSLVTMEGSEQLKNHDYHQAFKQKNMRTLKLGSIAYELAMTGAGQFEATIFCATNPWDVAAAKVIIEEAGGVTSDLYGQDQRYDQPVKGFVGACTAQLHGELLDVLGNSLE